MAVVASVVLHGAVGLVLFGGTLSMVSPPPPETYRVQLAAPAPEEAPERLEPSPPEPAEEEERPPPPEEVPTEEPEVERPTVVEETPEPESPEPEPARAPEEGEEAVNVQIEGATFAYPEYLENIIRQIQRYWRPPTERRNLRAEISFTIRENGSVTDIRWVQRSGALSFDLEARGAIEAAGNRQAFGPLPERYPRDRLRVSFYFDPTER